MDILLFGATGGTGRHLLTAALEAGHHVTALVRHADRVGVRHERLRVVVGDATDASWVDALVAGKDAVLSALGAPAVRRTRVREEATREQVAAMTRHGVRRLISLSSHGVGDSASTLPWLMRWVVVPFYLRGVFADHDAQEALVRASDLDWTLVRPTHLSDGPATGAYHVGFHELPRGSRVAVSRADVAAFMLGQLEDRTYLRQPVSITS